VICLHGTGGSKDGDEIRKLLYRFSQLGYMAISIDGRYHGERVIAKQKTYVEAITEAWQSKDPTDQKHPFYFDTVYDLWRLIDYISTRPDVDSNRIGMMGISKGGIETWMAASVDTRIKVAGSRLSQLKVLNGRWRMINGRVVQEQSGVLTYRLQKNWEIQA
jgi:cephalosporin-C deacetylase-like acetyl esterase